ncbi:hypothetical protein ACFLTO_02030 [Chloroflexota bacterium]
MDVSSSNGIIKIDQGVPPSYPFSLYFDDGTKVTVEAVSAFGYVFDGWGGDLSGTTNPAILIIDCDKNIIADFSIDWILVGVAISSLAMVVFLVSVLIIKPRAG